MLRFACLFALLAILAGPIVAQDRTISLAAPVEMADSGFLKHVLPRFSLKHGIRITILGPTDPADISFVDEGSEGKAMFDGPTGTWRLVESGTGDPAHIERFRDWLGSTAGQAAVAGFEVDGAAPYGPPSEVKAVVAQIEYEGDVDLGAKLSLGLCGRCHVVGDMNRMSGIGSTPSFAVLRTMADWENRFVAFYVLKPHAAFTQVIDVTPPFPEELPPFIAPIEMSLDDLDNIVAYVAQIEPPDLGAPIVHQ